jgi:hypothetical protein
MSAIDLYLQYKKNTKKTVYSLLILEKRSNVESVNLQIVHSGLLAG